MLGFKEVGELVEGAFRGGANVSQIVAGFLALAEAEAGDVAVVVEELEHVADDGGEIGREIGREVAADVLGDVGDGAGGGDVSGEGADEAVFVAKVAVEGGDADVGFLGDLLHGDVQEAVTAEYVSGGTQDASAYVAGCHCV